MRISDWSSDVCSSDLHTVVLSAATEPTAFREGFVHEAIAADIDNMAGWKAYVAGPPAMVEAVGQVCRERHLRDSDLHADVFFTPESGSRSEERRVGQEGVSPCRSGWSPST